jgi:hypothetical protein
MQYADLLLIVIRRVYVHKKIVFLWLIVFFQTHSVWCLQNSSIQSRTTRTTLEKLVDLQKEYATTYAFLLFHCIKYKDCAIPSHWWNNHLGIVQKFGLLEKHSHKEGMLPGKAEEQVKQEVVDFFSTVTKDDELELLYKKVQSWWNLLLFDKLPFDIDKD